MKPWIVLFAILFLSACGKEGGSNRGPCEEFNWPSPTTDQVVCPYTQDCVCPITDVCCVTVQNEEFQGAACSSLESCSAWAYQCDGPEDCAAGEACCVDVSAAGGSSCVSPDSCLGELKDIMCRADEDCATGETCQPAIPDSFFEGVAGYCEPL